MLDRALPPAALAAEVAQLTGGAPVEVVYDTISHADTQALGFALLAPGGALVTTLATNLPADVLDAGAAAGKRVVNVFGSVHHPDNRAFGAELYGRLEGLLRSGAIVVRFRCRFWERGGCMANVGEYSRTRSRLCLAALRASRRVCNA